MSKYKLTTLQQKMFLEVALYLKNNQSERFCTIVVRDFYEMIGVKTGDYNELYAQIKQMLEMVIHIPKARKKDQVAYLDAPMFASVEVGADKFNRATIEIEVSEKLKPYFIEIAEGDFFSYRIENTRNLKSPQSTKMYLYLRSWAWVGKHTILYSELRDILGIDTSDYKFFKDFRVRVLDKAQKEIHEKTDLRFDYSLIREVPSNPNTPVEKISFKINGGSSSESLTNQIAIPLTLEPDKELMRLANEIEIVEPKELGILLASHGQERLHEVLLVAREQTSKGIPIRSLIAFLHTALKNNSGTGKLRTKKEKMEQARLVETSKEIERTIKQGFDDFKTNYLIELAVNADQPEKNKRFQEIQKLIAKNQSLKKLYMEGEEWNLETLKVGVGGLMNKKSDDEIAVMYMQSIGKPVIKDKRFWKYIDVTISELVN